MGYDSIQATINSMSFLILRKALFKTDVQESTNLKAPRNCCKAWKLNQQKVPRLFFSHLPCRLYQINEILGLKSTLSVPNRNNYFFMTKCKTSAKQSAHWSAILLWHASIWLCWTSVTMLKLQSQQADQGIVNKHIIIVDVFSYSQVFNLHRMNMMNKVNPHFRLIFSSWFRKSFSLLLVTFCCTVKPGNYDHRRDWEYKWSYFSGGLICQVCFKNSSIWSYTLREPWHRRFPRVSRGVIHGSQDSRAPFWTGIVARTGSVTCIRP